MDKKTLSDMYDIKGNFNCQKYPRKFYDLLGTVNVDANNYGLTFVWKHFQTWNSTDNSKFV